jgi:hypothetical protein
VSQWLLFATSLFQAAPATVPFVLWTIAVCAGVRTLVFAAASVVALAASGERAKRALALARLVAWRWPIPQVSLPRRCRVRPGRVSQSLVARYFAPLRESDRDRR